MVKKWTTILAAPLVLLFGLLALSAQTTPETSFKTNIKAELIPNLGSLKNDVQALKNELRQYHDCTCTCGCYADDLETQANLAIEYLRQRAANRGANEKLALILDIDETTLSNYQELSDADFEYVTTAFDAWVKTTQAPAIPGTLRIYKEAQRLGVSIFFITGRSEKEREATETNLRQEKFYNVLPEQLIMLPVEHGSQTIGEFKAAERAKIVKQGFTLILNVGDQWSDLKGKPEAEFSVKYPDPYYFVQ
jgi:5'-nucleotidase (lipoprotein e(P4) family)